MARSGLLDVRRASTATSCAPGERCISTSNRNFEHRQGPRSRTHLASPAMVGGRRGHRPHHRRPQDAWPGMTSTSSTILTGVAAPHDASPTSIPTPSSRSAGCAPRRRSRRGCSPLALRRCRQREPGLRPQPGALPPGAASWSPAAEFRLRQLARGAPSGRCMQFGIRCVSRRASPTSSTRTPSATDCWSAASRRRPWPPSIRPSAAHAHNPVFAVSLSAPPSPARTAHPITSMCRARAPRRFCAVTTRSPSRSATSPTSKTSTVACSNPSPGCIATPVRDGHPHEHACRLRRIAQANTSDAKHVSEPAARE